MSYVPTDWENEIPSTTPLKYQIVDDVDGTIAESASIELVTPVTAGTPVNAANLNHIEEGLTDLDDRVSALETGGWITGVFTSTAWDGDAKSANTEYTIDINADFGVPSAAKAVIVYISALLPYAASSVYVGTYGKNNKCVAVRSSYGGQYNESAGVVPVASGKITVKIGAYAANGITLQISGYLL